MAEARGFICRHTTRPIWIRRSSSNISRSSTTPINQSLGQALRLPSAVFCPPHTLPGFNPFSPQRRNIVTWAAPRNLWGKRSAHHAVMDCGQKTFRDARAVTVSSAVATAARADASATSSPAARPAVQTTECKVCLRKLQTGSHQCRQCYHFLYNKVADMTKSLAKHGVPFDTSGTQAQCVSRLREWCLERSGVARKCADPRKLVCTQERYHHLTDRFHRCQK